MSELIQHAELHNSAAVDALELSDIAGPADPNHAGQNEADPIEDAVPDFSRAARLGSSALQALLALDGALKRARRTS